MESRAVARYVRITPRKVNQVLDLIRGKDVEEAQRILSFTPKHGARVAEKVLRSAVANAVDRDASLDIADLFVREAIVGRGAIMKRWLPRAQGRATPLLKRTSHVTIRVAKRETED
jgi:large subunit ribosomal protein L22